MIIMTLMKKKKYPGTSDDAVGSFVCYQHISNYEIHSYYPGHSQGRWCRTTSGQMVITLGRSWYDPGMILVIRHITYVLYGHRLEINISTLALFPTL